MDKVFFQTESVACFDDTKKVQVTCEFYDSRIILKDKSQSEIKSFDVYNYEDISVVLEIKKGLFSKRYIVAISSGALNKCFLTLTYKKSDDADSCKNELEKKIKETSEINSKNEKYEKACTLLNEDTKDTVNDALVLLVQISPWKNSEDLIEKAKIRIEEFRKDELYKKAINAVKKAEKSSKKADYEDAIKQLNDIIDWKDSNDHLSKCQSALDAIIEKENKEKQEQYEQAIALSKEDTIEHLETAIELLPEGWKDSAKLVQNFQMRIDAIKEEQENARRQKSYDSAVEEAKKDTITSYEKAVRVLSSLKGWKDSEKLIASYNKRIEEIKQKEEEERKNKLYDDAVKLSSVNSIKDIESAIKIFEKIPDWKDSTLRIDDCKRAIKKLQEAEFYERIEKVIETGKEQPDDKDKYKSNIQKHLKNAFDLVAKNPFFILGISTTSDQSKILDTKDKIEKFARLKMAGGYKSSFDLKNIERPKRDIGNIQNAIVSAKELSSRWLFFATDKYCCWWDCDEIFELFEKEKSENEYDLILACYFNRLITDPEFKDKKKWDVVLSTVGSLCSMKKNSILPILQKHIYSTNSFSDQDIIDSFKETILKPIAALLEGTTKTQAANFAKISIPKSLYESICTAIVTNVTSLCYPLDIYVKEIENDKSKTDVDKLLLLISDVENNVYKNIDTFISIVGADSTYAKRIKKKYKETIWNSTNILNSNNKKSKSIPFIKEIYDYCDNGDKQRLRNTYGYDKLGLSENDLTPDELNDVALEKEKEGYVTEGIRLLELAANRGSAIAQSNLAFRYSEGKVVFRNQTKAVQLWKKSANQGNNVAQFALYRYYFDLGANGYSTYADSNIREAMRWLRKACDQNFEPAMEVFNNIINMAKGYDYQQRNLAIQLLRWMGLDV